MLGVCHGPRLGHVHHAAAEEQRDLGRTVSGLSLSLALLSHPCEVMYPALVLVLVTVMFFEKCFFWEVSKVLLSFQTKLSERVVVCRQNWQKVSVLTTSNKSKWEKVKSGSLLAMSKQLPKRWAGFPPLGSCKRTS